LRVPLLARLPRALRGAAGGRHVAEVVNLVDVVPTILELAGQPAAAPIQGRSLAPLLTAARADDPAHAAVAEWNGLLQNMHAREPVFANVTDFYIRCVRTRDWKLSANPGDTWELYDLAHDPGEMQNVLFEAGNRGVARELFDKLRGWQSQTGDTIDVGQLPDSPATQA
jgi:arylsulfatase A-like enzyme